MKVLSFPRQRNSSEPFNLLNVCRRCLVINVMSFVPLGEMALFLMEMYLVRLGAIYL